MRVIPYRVCLLSQNETTILVLQNVQFEFRQVSEVKRFQYFRKRYIACFADICYSFQKIKMITSTGHNLPSSSSRLKVLKFFCLE